MVISFFIALLYGGKIAMLKCNKKYFFGRMVLFLLILRLNGSFDGYDEGSTSTVQPDLPGLSAQEVADYFDMLVSVRDRAESGSFDQSEIVPKDLTEKQVQDSSDLYPSVFSFSSDDEESEIVEQHHGGGKMSRRKGKYKCPYCPNVYTIRDSFKRHVKTIHEHPLSYKCQKCPKSFNDKSNCRRHEETHDTERPAFVCPYCKFFHCSNKQEVFRHIQKKHLGEKVQVNKAMIKNNRVNQKSGADDKDSEQEKRQK